MIVFTLKKKKVSELVSEYQNVLLQELVVVECRQAQAAVEVGLQITKSLTVAVTLWLPGKSSPSLVRWVWMTTCTGLTMVNQLCQGHQGKETVYKVSC